MNKARTEAIAEEARTREPISLRASLKCPSQEIGITRRKRLYKITSIDVVEDMLVVTIKCECGDTHFYRIRKC